MDWSPSSDGIELWSEDVHILVNKDVVVWDGRSICLPSLAKKIKGLGDQLRLVNIRKVKPSVWVRG